MPKRKREMHRGRGRRKQKNEEEESTQQPIEETETDNHQAKRRRHNTDARPQNDDFVPLDDDGGFRAGRTHGSDTREFFGMLSDEEQEYFRRADEMLELNDFPSTEDRDMFLENVFREAEGKELKLASSQSCSRLMERLILLSTTPQKKHLFNAFANHFLTLVTHRFGSHCCERLFIQSAPVITEELGGGFDSGSGHKQTGEGDQAEEEPTQSMEELFLLVLDELEDSLSFLLTDTFGSHTLRVLLTVLSGRTVDQVSISLLQSKRKEKIWVPGAQPIADEPSTKARPVPDSFRMALLKVISDTTSTLDSTAMGVLVKHKTGNPVLQLLLELDIALNMKSKEKGKSSSDEGREIAQQTSMTLLDKLLPGAPESLRDERSEASIFVNSAIYDPIGSHLLETLITHCPGKIFKTLYAHMLGPRLDNLLRNETATYSVMRTLNRLSKEDLADAVQKALPKVEMLVSKNRFNVLTTLFERCAVREATDAMITLLKALQDACNASGSSLVRRLCFLDSVDEEKKDGKGKGKKKNKEVVGDFGQQDEAGAKTGEGPVNHGAKLAATLLTVGGASRHAVQGSLLFLEPEKLLQLATSSYPRAHFLASALHSPSANPVFHKLLVNPLMPHIMDLARSSPGSKVLCAIPTIPSRMEGFALPFFMKQSIMAALVENETELRESHLGRKVWKEWRGDKWLHRHSDWVEWAKVVDPESGRRAKVPSARPIVSPTGTGRQKTRHWDKRNKDFRWTEVVQNKKHSSESKKEGEGKNGERPVEGEKKKKNALNPKRRARLRELQGKESAKQEEKGKSIAVQEEE